MNKTTQADPARDYSHQAIGFHIGNEEYALPLTVVREVMTLPKITRVPLAPGYIRGVINLRGNIVPVIDVAKRLGIGDTNLGDDSRIIAVDVPGETVALAAEAVSKVTRVTMSAMKEAPAGLHGIPVEYLDGVARMDDRFLIFLNVNLVLGVDFMEMVS